MPRLNLTPLLRSTLSQKPESVPAALESIGRDLGVADVIVYLVDFGQKYLEPLGDYSTHGELPHSEEVATTMAGRAFISQEPVTAERPTGVRLWVPICEGSDRTGVLALTLPDGDPDATAACAELGILAGYIIATNARVSDIFNLHRRRKSMTLAASMQWDLLPPLDFVSPQVSTAGLLEPAYEVGGDCFDYAMNWPVFNVAIMDSMGHGLNSAVMSGLALGCYRHERRHGRALGGMHEELDAVIESRYGGRGFVTGQLAQLNVETGHLQWTNAGHPLPLHIRGGQVIGDLACRPTVPWGIGRKTVEPTVADVALEPGDGVLFYTDGVTDGRARTGTPFGLDRLIDLVGQMASDQLGPQEIVRLIVRRVLEHHSERLSDDATLFLVKWTGSE